MQRRTGLFIVKNVVAYKQQMLNWANQFGICCFMDSCSYKDAYSSYDCLLAAGAVHFFLPTHNILSQLKTFTKAHNDWLFGHICYDVKNEIENLSSNHPDSIQFPALFFFQPQTVIMLAGNQITIACIDENPADIHQQIQKEIITKAAKPFADVHLRQHINQDEYIKIVKKLQKHIARGDCYEINFCPHFFAENSHINPLEAYKKLIQISPAPMACFYKIEDKYALCASPERYIKKLKNQIISQPIKGTAKRDLNNKQNDEALKQQLISSAKNKSENVMITDLVRNDLSKICSEGSVHVKELFGIYTYPQIHQMITTIAGNVQPDINIADVLQATFPMGSMTGAPKLKVMQLIEQYESAKRGLYSGCIGYITPENNFDFNVVIRSILYNETNQYISCSAGSAITFYSDAEEEYDECLLKKKAMQQALGNDEM